MAELQSSLPVVELGPGSSIVFEALDPLNGTAVTTVTVANVAITLGAATGGGDAVALPAVLGYTSGQA